MRGVAVGAVGLLLGVFTWAVAVVTPSSADGGPVATAAAPDQTDHLVCPTADFLRTETEMVLMATRGGEIDLWKVSDGEWLPYGDADLGGTGGWRDRAPSGNAVLLSESGLGWSGAGMSNIGPGAISSWMCGGSLHRSVALGGSTRADESLDLILYNPYALDTTATVKISTELGEDTPSGIAEIYVPSGREVEVSLDESLRLRRSIGVQVDSHPARVALLLRQAGSGETAVVEGVAPHIDWWLPVPDVGQSETSLFISSPSGSAFSYRVDLMTVSGPVPGFLEEEFLPEQLVSVPLSDLPDGVTGIRVSGTVELVAGLRLEGEGMLAIGPGARGTSRRWFVPAAGGDENRENQVWLLNPTGVPVSVAVSALAEGAYSQSMTIEPESVLGVNLEDLTGLARDLPGYLVDAEGEIAVTWTSLVDGTAVSLAPGAPVG